MFSKFADNTLYAKLIAKVPKTDSLGFKIEKAGKPIFGT